MCRVFGSVAFLWHQMNCGVHYCIKVHRHSSLYAIPVFLGHVVVGENYALMVLRSLSLHYLVGLQLSRTGLDLRVALDFRITLKSNVGNAFPHILFFDFGEQFFLRVVIVESTALVNLSLLLFARI